MTESRGATAASDVGSSGVSALAGHNAHVVGLVLGAMGPYVYAPARSIAATGGEGDSLWIDALRIALPTIALASVLLRRTTRHRVRLGLPEIGFVGFGFVAAASTVWSVAPLASGYKAASFLLSLGCLLALRAYYPTGQAFLKCLTATLHVVLLGVAAQFALLPNQTFGVVGEYVDIARLRSVIPNIGSNPLGYLAFFGLVAVLLGLVPTRLSAPSVRLLLLGIYATELVLTRTRSVLPLLVVFCAIAIVWGWRSRGFFVASMLAMGSALLIAGSRASEIYAFLLRDQQSLATLTGRTLLWQQARAYWSDAPVLGHGYYSGHRIGLVRYAGVTQSNVDNTWLEAGLDLGWLGVFFLALAVLGSVVRLRVGRKRLPPEQWFLGVTILVSTVSVSWLNPTFQSPGIIQFMAVGVTLSMSRNAWES